MDIKLFTTSNVNSPFELGGLEFYGNIGNFTRSEYRSQDLQMIFISLVDFSFAIRQRKNRFSLSSKIDFFYNEKTGIFFVNKIKIEKISYRDLLRVILNVTNEAAFLLKNVVDSKDSVFIDLIREIELIEAEIGGG